MKRRYTIEMQIDEDSGGKELIALRVTRKMPDGSGATISDAVSDRSWFLGMLKIFKRLVKEADRVAMQSWPDASKLEPFYKD